MHTSSPRATNCGTSGWPATCVPEPAATPTFCQATRCAKITRFHRPTANKLRPERSEGHQATRPLYIQSLFPSLYKVCLCCVCEGGEKRKTVKFTGLLHTDLRVLCVLALSRSAAINLVCWNAQIQWSKPSLWIDTDCDWFIASP